MYEARKNSLVQDMDAGWPLVSHPLWLANKKSFSPLTTAEDCSQHETAMGTQRLPITPRYEVYMTLLETTQTATLQSTAKST
jgi:hypothetical protein